MERPYNLLVVLQSAPDGFEEKPVRVRVLCKTIRVAMS